MPYVDIAQGNDFASLWYITNSPTGHVSSFDPDKPTVILLHPFFLDSTWLDSQFGDPRLNEDYNLIGFDQRAAGRTLSRPNGKRDSWTDAADLAFACHVRKNRLATRRSFPFVTRKECCLRKTEALSAFDRLSGCRRHTFGQVRQRELTSVSALPPCTQSLLRSRIYLSRGAEYVTFRFPQMVLSLTMLSVPSPRVYVSDVRLGCRALLD